MYVEVFVACANFLIVAHQQMQHLTKDILTTKITKATKDLEILDSKLRALRALRGQICFAKGARGFRWLETSKR